MDCSRKVIRVRMEDSDGKVYFWRVQRVPRALNVGVMRNHKCVSRVISGWEFEDHEGYARFAEGTWIDLVARFKETASNYGLTHNLS